MLIAGCGALLLGGLLAIFAGDSLRRTQTNPIESLGPRAYVVDDILSVFVYLAFVLIPGGAALVLVAWRRLRSRRTTGT